MSISVRLARCDMPLGIQPRCMENVTLPSDNRTLRKHSQPRRYLTVPMVIAGEGSKSMASMFSMHSDGMMGKMVCRHCMLYAGGKVQRSATGSAKPDLV
jgi:hypothetical protein